MAEGAPGWSKIGLIAGGGALPLKLAQACEAAATPFFAIRLAGHAETGLNAFPGADIRLGDVGAALTALKRADCDAVLFAGIVRRPDFRALRPDWKGAKLLPRIIAAATRGDDALLSCLVRIVEEEGFAVIGADEILHQLLAAAGPLGALAPDAEHLKDIEKGREVLRALGALDVGQGAVICDEHVLAVEAAEGTDAMLARCAQLPAPIRGAPGAPRGVLVKAPKPGQERRVDLPVIGVRTIELAAAAGLAGVAIEAGGALVIDGATALRAADAHGLFVYGMQNDCAHPG